jgi:hypothetical protein
MKGIALQTVILASLDGLHAAWVTCVQGSAADAERLVGEAWGYYAANKGPIALGEKRCPQFDTCDDYNLTVNGMTDIRSTVNHKINAQFLLAAQNARERLCNGISAAQDAIRSQVYVPVIQGMMRYA